MERKPDIENRPAVHLNELSGEQLAGRSIEGVKCRACSGYGACGYKTFYMHDGVPYAVCNLALQKR